MKIHFENFEEVFSVKQFTAKYDRANRLLFVKYDGLPNLELIKNGLEAIILHAQSNKVITTVMDFTTMKGTFTAANSYIKERFAPTMKSLGRKYSAMISSSDPFTIFAINTVTGMVGPMLDVKMLANVKECEEWLSQLEEYKNKS